MQPPSTPEPAFTIIQRTGQCGVFAAIWKPEMKRVSLRGKGALIMDAASGIGRGVAFRLAGVGGSIAVTDMHFKRCSL